MPKMGKEYFTQKRNKILNAAFTVCMKKPMHEVSMRDIISESGLSQGGIYRYYSNIDEVLIDLINLKTVDYDAKMEIDAAILSDNTPERILGELFSIWEKSTLDNILGVGKIYYEICVIYVNDHERLINFVSKIRGAADEAYLKEKGFEFCVKKIEEGHFRPKLPIEDIFIFLGTSFDGIIRDLIISTHYNAPMFPQLEKNRLVKSLCTAFVLLLGGNEKLIYSQEGDVS